MYDMITVYLDYDVNDIQKRLAIENEIKYLDKLVEQHGWKYSGVANVYIPIVKETREETIDKVTEVIAMDERLKKYSPKVICGTMTNVCTLKEIDIQHMTKPRDIKYNRYEKYFLGNKELAHDIIVDENKQIRDGYISYLIAQKYGYRADVIEVPKECPISKIVIGHHVEYDIQQKLYVPKQSKRYAWIYKLPEAVVPGDILIVRTSKGPAYMQVEKISNIAGKNRIKRYKNVIVNFTALNEKE